ncbi:MAG: hypothetical protein QW727_04025 [Candidatus Pacearchaeota archaeon]
MKYKKNSLIIFLSIILFLIIFFYFKGYYNMPNFPFAITVTPTAGGQFIKNSEDPNSPYTKILSTNSYRCDADECIVSGSMTVNKPIGDNIVNFRGTTNYLSFDASVAFAIPGTSTLQSYQLVSSTISPISNNNCGQTKSSFLFSLPNPYVEVHYLNGKLFLCAITSTGTLGARYFNIGGNANTNNQLQTGEQCNQGLIHCDSNLVYSANFNFCPNDINFPFCSNSPSNFVLSTTPNITYFTDEKRILRGDVVTFNPKNKDLSDVTNRYIRTRNYDLTCNKLLISPTNPNGETCITNQIKCVINPNSGNCQSGYTKYTSGYTVCPYGSEIGSGEATLTNPICKESGWSQISNGGLCKKVIPNDFTKYQKCDSTKTISNPLGGSSICNVFGTTQYTAPTGQECFLLDSNYKLTQNHGTGLGALACPTSQCYLGQKEKISENTYRECITSGLCLVWSSEKYCPTGLVFNIVTNSCELPSEGTCSPGQQQCISDGTKQILKCVQVTISGKTGYRFSSTPDSCPGDTLCKLTNDGINYNDICSCDKVNTCKEGEIQCITSTTYKVCAKDPKDINSCLAFRDLGAKVSQYEQCVGNKIIPRTDIGCSFSSTPEFACSQEKDKNGILIEQCIQNQCQITQDLFTATESDFLNQATRCLSSNTVQKVSKYIGKEIISYRWENDNSTQNSENGICLQDYLCAQSSINKAECIPSGKFISIISNSSFGINKPISNIQVILSSDVPNKANKPILARILENNVEIAGTRINTFTDSTGKVTLNFKYSHPRTADLVIEVIAGDPNGENFKQSKPIKISQTLDLLLNCPTQAFVGKEVICTWKILNLDTNNLESVSDLKIIIKQGINDVSYTPLSQTSLSFKSNIPGGVLVKIEVNKGGFIGDSEELLVTLQDVSQVQFFEIDNKDISTYTGLGVSVGTHQINVKIKNSAGDYEDVQSVTGVLRTPSGEEVPLTFTKTSQGIFVSSYNFQQAGTTYTFKGFAVFSDITKPQLQFEYPITTLASYTEKEKTNTYLIITIISAIIVIVFIIIVFIAIGFRQNKRR